MGVLIALPLHAPRSTGGIGNDCLGRIVACIIWHWCHAARYRSSLLCDGGGCQQMIVGCATSKCDSCPPVSLCLATAGQGLPKGPRYAPTLVGRPVAR